MSGRQHKPAEVLSDTRLRVPPLRSADGRAILAQLRGARLFEAFRGQTARGVDTLAQIVANLSALRSR